MNQIYSSFLLIFDILDSFQYLIFINNVSMNAFESMRPGLHHYLSLDSSPMIYNEWVMLATSYQQAGDGTNTLSTKSLEDSMVSDWDWA